MKMLASHENMASTKTASDKVVSTAEVMARRWRSTAQPSSTSAANANSSFLNEPSILPQPLKARAAGPQTSAMLDQEYRARCSTPRLNARTSPTHSI